MYQQSMWTFFVYQMNNPQNKSLIVDYFVDLWNKSIR